MTRICLYVCDHCNAESRENNLVKLEVGRNFERELCQKCSEGIIKLIRMSGAEGDRFLDAEILRSAADVIKAYQDDPVLESALRAKAAMLEDK